MARPGSYLLDSFLDYAQENKMTLKRAAKTLAEFAKQRAPEKKIEEQTTDARSKMRDQVAASPREYVVARVLVKRRVRYLRWCYYPQFHVVTGPRDYWWCTIRYSKPWRPKRPEKHLYLDDLFHDAEHDSFWMPEPYLDGLPESAALYAALADPEAEKLEGTDYRKIDPQLIAAFRRARARAPEFRKRLCEKDEIWDRRPYGSRGWKKRIALVPTTFRRIRLRW